MGTLSFAHPTALIDWIEQMQDGQVSETQTPKRSVPIMSLFHTVLTGFLR